MSDDVAKAPWSVSDAPPSPVVLTGKLFPWDGVQPALMHMTGSPHLYLSLFDTEEGLRALMDQAGIPFVSIKQVEDGGEFLESVPMHDPDGTPLVVILNPRFTERGTVRFTQVQRGGSDSAELGRRYRGSPGAQMSDLDETYHTDPRAFLDAYDAWAPSFELCGGPLFDAMVEARGTPPEPSAEYNRSWAGYAEAFLIFAKYGKGEYSTAAEHDIIYSGPDPELVSKSDTARLEALGWSPSGHNGWERFT